MQIEIDPICSGGGLHLPRRFPFDEEGPATRERQIDANEAVHRPHDSDDAEQSQADFSG